MKVTELLAMCDDTKPNQYDEITKVQWLSEVEGIVVDEILNKAEGNDIEFDRYDPVQDMEKDLLVPDRFADLYLHYLYAKIDFSNAEYSRYNNSVAMYNASYDAYAGYYRRTHMPKQPASFPRIV
jgi:hypothetical protein